MTEYTGALQAAKISVGLTLLGCAIVWALATNGYPMIAFLVALPTLYLLCIGTPLACTSVLRSAPWATGKVRLFIYIVWVLVCAGIAISPSYSNNASAEIVSIPEYVNAHGLFALSVLITSAITFTIIRTNKISGYSICPYLSQAVLLIVLILDVKKIFGLAHEGSPFLAFVISIFALNIAVLLGIKLQRAEA